MCTDTSTVRLGVWGPCFKNSNIQARSSFYCDCGAVMYFVDLVVDCCFCNAPNCKCSAAVLGTGMRTNHRETKSDQFQYLIKEGSGAVHAFSCNVRCVTWVLPTFLFFSLIFDVHPYLCFTCLICFGIFSFALSLFLQCSLGKNGLVVVDAY